MSTVSDKRPGTVWAVMVLPGIQALGAIGGGVGLVRNPVDNIGMPLNMLGGSPFSDYLVPGLILLIVVGLFPVAALCGLARRHRWGWWAAVAAGADLVIWMATEIILLGRLPATGVGLQIGMGVLGLLVLILTLMRPARRYLAVGGRTA